MDYDEKIHQNLELNVEKSYFFNGTRFNQTIYLKYVINDNLDPENDLVLIARPNDFKSDPDMMVSKTVQFPNPENAEYRCWHSGLDICYIPYSWLEGSKEIYISLFSFQPYCNFTFEAKYQHRTEQMLEWNKEQVLFLGSQGEKHEESSQLVKIYVPPEESIEHFTFTTMVDTNSRQKLKQAVKLYVMFGNETPSNSRSLWGIYSSNFGEIFTAFKGQQTFRTGTNYTLLIIGQTNTTVNVLCRKDTADPIPLQLGSRKTLFDAIPVGRSLVYEVDTGMMKRNEQTNKLNQTLIINLLVQQGNPDMYIDCDKPLTLDKLENAKWVSDSNGFETLMISAKEFQLYEKECKKIYITIYSRVCAAFALDFIVRPESFEQEEALPIYPNVSENGYIEDNQIINYLLLVEKSVKEQITVNLYAKNGNPDLFIRKCKNEKTCLVTRQELESVQFSKNSDFIGFSNQLGNDNIVFNHSHENCDDTNNLFCQYLITVFSNVTNSDNSPAKTVEIHYSLLVQYQSKNVFLTENTPLQQEVSVEQFNYYTFNLVSLEDIKKIYFQVTPISGIMELLVSRYHQNPSFRQTEKIACFCSNVISYSIEELLTNKQASSIFYMGIYGFSNSVYTITVYIERYEKDSEGKNDPNSSIIQMNLSNGIPQKYVFETSSDYVYFDINEIDFDSVVSLNPLKGDFQLDAWALYSNNISKYQPPSSSDKEYVYSSHYNSIILNIQRHSKENFKGFRVRVTKLLNREQSQFIIDYSTQSKIANLFESTPIQTLIQPDTTKFFKFIINYDDYIVAISYTSSHTGLIMQISGDQIHKNEDVNIKYETTGMSESSIYIFNAYTLECKDKLLEEKCFVYGMIKMSEQAQQNYSKENKSLPTSITITKFNRQFQTQGIQLQDGSINYYPIPTEETKNTEYYSLNFYIHPTNFDLDFQSILTLEHGNLIAKYLVVDTSGQGMSKPSMWNYPTLTQAEEKFLTDSTSDEIRNKVTKMINISKDEFLCRPKCVILISAFAKNVQKVVKNSQLVVQVVSDILDVSSLQSVEITGNVPYNSYKYYLIHLPNNEHILTINAITTQNQLDINLVATYNTPKLRPTESCDNCLQSNLEPGNYDQIEFIPAKAGDYIVGVYGSEGYSIDYKFTWSVNQIQQVNSNQSYRTHLSVQKSYIFHADPLKNSGIQLAIAILNENNINIVSKGKLEISVGNCQSDFLKGCIAENPKFKLINERDISFEYSEICKDQTVCTVVFSFKPTIQENIIFDFLIEEIPRTNVDFVSEVISISSDQSIVSKISSKQKKRYQVNLPFTNASMDQQKYILRVQQITGNVNISLWPKEQTHEVKDIFQTFKWIEINSETLQKMNSVYIDVFGCNVSQCTFDIALYQTQTPKDISKLLSIAEFISKNNQIIITGVNQSFKNNNIVIYYENTYPELVSKRISVQKNGDIILNFDIKEGNHYQMLDNLYDKNIGPSDQINLFITLDDNNKSQNKQIPIAIFLMKLDGQQIKLQHDYYDRDHYNNLQFNKFNSQQLSATFIVDIPEEGHVLIELRSCNKQLTLQASSNIDKFESGDFDLTFIEKHKDKTFFYAKVQKKGKVYIKVLRPKQQFGQELQYFIGSCFFKKDVNPLKSPVFETSVRNGLVEIKKSGKEHIISWDFLAGTSDFDDAKEVLKHTKFNLILVNNDPDKATFIQNCESPDTFKVANETMSNQINNSLYFIIEDSEIQIDQEAQHYYMKVDIQKYLQNINIKELKEEKLYLTIKASIKPSIYKNPIVQQQLLWKQDINYNISPIDNSILNREQIVEKSTDVSQSYTIIIVTVIVSIGLILLAIFLYRRYRLTQKRIKYEISYREQDDISQDIEESRT